MKVPPIGPGSPPQGPEDVKRPKISDISNVGQADYKTWGGMKFTKKQWDDFMNNILKSVSQQIQDDLQRSLKALDRIKAVAEGRDPDDD